MKVAGVVFLVLALLVVGLWVSHDAELATREKVAVTTRTVDDFGDEVETVTWKEPTGYPVTGFHVGLDRAAPVMGGLGALGVLLLVLGFRRKKQG
jgi:hypothetical protein